MHKLDWQVLVEHGSGQVESWNRSCGGRGGGGNLGDCYDGGGRRNGRVLPLKKSLRAHKRGVVQCSLCSCGSPPRPGIQMPPPSSVRACDRG